MRGYEPGRWAPLVAPTPLLMIVSPLDRLADGQLATEAYQAALHPIELVLVPGGHFDVYTQPVFDTTARAARGSFTQHLVPN
jgi:fermentation-respiration switch protein FrsA (DUF1100 family)